MEAYKKRIDECTDLESLFALWQEAQKNEENYELTFPGKGTLPIEFRNNWTDDGYLSDNKDDIDILFILKEPNEQSTIDKEDEKVFGYKEFWIKNNINNFRCAIPRRMYKATRKLVSEDLTKETWIKKAAVMNLNKRGGYSQTDPTQLLNYVKTYKAFICKEIEIINPKIIVFLCGVNNDTKNIIDELNLSDKYCVFYSYHPSYKGKHNSFKDNCFLESIKSIK